MKSKTRGIRVLAAMVMAVVFAIAEVCNLCVAQTYINRVYDVNVSNISPLTIASTKDGNFLIAGTDSISPDIFKMLLMKISPVGDTLWQKTYGDRSLLSQAIIPTADDNFIIAGSYFGNMCALKINSLGDSLWVKNYYGRGSYGIAPTQDGNFIITGSPLDGNGILLIKISPDGDTIWSKTFSISTDMAIKITASGDGGFFVAGSTRDSLNINDMVFVLKIRSDGSILFLKTFHIAYAMHNTMIFSLVSTLDGGCIIGGSRANGLGWGNACIYRVRQNGDTAWTRTYLQDAYSVVKDISLALDSGFLLAGALYSHVPYVLDIPGFYLMKIHTDGNEVWTREYGNNVPSENCAIISARNETSIVVGRIYKTWFSSVGAISIQCVVDDRFAKKDSLFTFKIPVSGDSLSHGYMPLKVPSGMTVSMGGTISWTPKIDSVFTDHIEFLVFDDLGKKDTLTFNIFANGFNGPIAAAKPDLHPQATKNKFDISINYSFSTVYFSVPPKTKSLAIYDLRGTLIEKLSVSNSAAVWRGTNSHGKAVTSGRYFAKAIDERESQVKAFMLLK